MRLILLYILTIYFTNLGFSYIPPIDVGFGLFSPMAICAGLVFVVRDYAQRSIGHWVMVGMVLGCALSYYMADPYVAIASVASFAISETTDYLFYTFTDKPFYKRMLISSIVAAPIDSFVFLTMVQIMTPATFVMMVICKLLTSGAIYYAGTKNEKGATPASV